MKLTIATRGSALALWQAEHVKHLLCSNEQGLCVDLLVLKTTGDRILDRPLHEIGGKGLFTKEIEEALLDGRADVAVHSLKDLPAESPPGLCFAGTPKREDPRDALLARPDLKEAVRKGGLSGLPKGAVLGTTSLRRRCQLLAKRPDLQMVPLRGNVDTRLRKLDNNEMDAMVLAVAGLNRLGYGDRIDLALPLDECVPAVGQGALALQCREADEAVLNRLDNLTDPEALFAVRAERAFLGRLGGGCKTPLGAHATVEWQVLHLTGLIGYPDGSKVISDRISGPVVSPEVLGEELADRLLQRGGGEILKSVDRHMGI